MQDLGDAWQYALDNRDTVISAIETQLQLSGVALAIALLICVPLGVVASSNRWVSLASVNLVKSP